MNKRLAAIGLAAGITAGGLAGATVLTPAISGAQTSDSSTTVAPTDQQGDPASHLSDTLAPLVQDGTLTQDQADAVVAALVANPPQHMGDHGHRGPGLDVAANAIGISVDDLRADLQSGQTIADVANANNVDPQTVIDAIVADVQSHVADEVANGTKTQDEADQILANATQRATDMVNNTMPAPPQGPPASSGSSTSGN